nr:hypothetical protein Q903MT_gene2430 [Picea sitchensis]
MIISSFTLPLKAPTDEEMIIVDDPTLYIECTIGPCYVKCYFVNWNCHFNVVSYDVLFIMHYTNVDI